LELPEPTESELKLLLKPQMAQAVGVHRELPAEGFTRQGQWMEAEGGRVWRLRISSPGAVHLRLHFRTFGVGDGEVWIYTPDRDAPAEGPFRGKGPWGDGDFWTAPVIGDSAVIEYIRAPGSRSPEIPFEVDKISHITKSLMPEVPPVAPRIWQNEELQTLSDLLPETVASCHEDISCHPSWVQSAGSVARISFESDGGSFVCSGSLLNTRSSSFVPYFLTNAHCIEGPATARTVAAFFNFQTGSCNGVVNSPVVVRGATYLVGSTPEVLDFALIRLADSPAGAWFAGWDAAAPSVGSDVAVIGHPAGTHKRIAFGRVIGRSGDQISYRYSRGLTEGGNSGGPFSIEPGVIRGVHARGNARNFEPQLCAALADGLVGGSGDLFGPIYNRIRPYLDDTSACNLTLAPASLVIGGSGGNATVAISTAAGCSWNATSNAPWITITGGSSGSGSGNLSLTIASNAGSARTGTVTVGQIAVTVQQSAAAPVCVNQPISPGATAGNLSVAACSSPRRPGRAAVLYSFNATAGQRASIAMSSTAVDPYLYLIGPSGQVVASDDDGGGGLNSRIPASSGFLTLPVTGTYIIDATTFNPGEQGAFTLTFTLESGSGASFNLIPSSLSFNLSPGLASNFQQVNLEGVSGAVTFQPSAPWILVESLTATSFRVGVTAAALSPGTYRGTVSFGTAASTANLDVTLQVRPPSGAQCPSIPISLGGAVNGVLDASACGASRRNALARRFAFFASAGDLIRITLTSPVVDPYLYLFGPDGQLLAEDDDSAGDLNSRIPASATEFFRIPATGEYVIEATTFFPGETGPFTLRTETSSTVTRERPMVTREGIVNGASGLRDYGRPGTELPGIAPGQLLGIFGTNMGPDQLVRTGITNNIVDTSIAGTRVLIGGIPAPLLYVRRDQVGAVVPFSVGQLREASIVVEAGGQASTPITLPVLSAAPGIFAAGTQCACQNASGNISPSNPAVRGEILTLYSTGLGQTLPLGVDGLLVFQEPLPRPILPVNVLIGGATAEILYAGIAPGLVGLMQLNVRVPSGIAVGGDVPIQIIQPDAATGAIYYSQTGLTLPIR
jgi:uncharacterized protein (TIGR03437 family)